MNNDFLSKKSNKIRQNIIEFVERCGVGHLGGSLSSTDLLVSLFYEHMEEEDSFILSKGHAAVLIYSILHEKGILSNEDVSKIGHPGSKLQTHPSISTPGVIFPSGSLGQGLSGAVGIALADKKMGKKSKTFALIGDGEMNEGQIWEAIMSASHYNLDNLVLLVDNNGFQLDGKIEDVMNLPKLNAVFESFGWNVKEVDGHDFTEIREAIKEDGEKANKPKVIICDTVKGKGISFMEQNNDFHSGYTTPGMEEYDSAMLELRKVEEMLYA